MVNQAGPTRTVVAAARLYHCGVASLGRDPELLSCPKKKKPFMDHFQYHVPFLLTSVVTSTCQRYPGALLFKGRLHRMAVISNVQYLRPAQEEQIEQVKKKKIATGSFL